ncbi:hypothetical protein CVE31_25265, partial [Pseudomonas syringae pv. actinidiae]|nr:hypothetical protein [Pseudomonas syringae pv. actinidiae]
GSNADHNYDLISFVADGLGDDFLAECAFVGGCTTAMLVTDSAVLDDIRCGFHGHPATHSMNIRPLIPR